MQTQYENQAQKRRFKSRYTINCTQRSFVDILICESLICILFAAVILYFKYTQNSFYFDIMQYVESIKSFSPKSAFAYIEHIISRALL